MSISQKEKGCNRPISFVELDAGDFNRGFITRQAHMAKLCTHREYYAQFVTAEILQKVVDDIGLLRIAASTGRCFNDIAIGRWDELGTPEGMHKTLRHRGDSCSLASLTSIYKEAALQLKEGYAKCKLFTS